MAAIHYTPRTIRWRLSLPRLGGLRAAVVVELTASALSEKGRARAVRPQVSWEHLDRMDQDRTRALSHRMGAGF